MAAPKGNQFWKLSTPNNEPKFKTSKELWEACQKYFNHVDENPWLQPNKKAVPMKVPYTLQGLQLFIGIHKTTWSDWRNNREDLSYVISMIEQIIYDDKFTGAAIGFYNANIISRDLGLVDKQEKEVKSNPLADLLKEIRSENSQ